jgi:HJR/Mrr/RecB family endonuclease
MENFNEEERLIPDYLKKLEKLANPFKGTAIDMLLESQKKIKQFTNPFEGTAIDHILMANKAAKQFNNIEQIISSSTITEVSKALESTKVISEKMQNMMAVSIAAQQIMSDIKLESFGGQWRESFSSKMTRKRAFGDYLRSTPLEAGGIFTHLELFGANEDEISENEDTEKLNTRIITLDDTIRVQKLIKSVYEDNEEIYRVDHFDFEVMIAELLREKGFIVHLTKKTRDGGKDIIALHDTNGLGLNKYLIECKRLRADRPVDINVVKNLCYTVNHEKANKGIIFTSSYFTKDAYKIKEIEKNILDFKDGVHILSWIAEYLKVKVV